MSYYTREEPMSSGQNASTNLDQDLHLSRDAKYKKSEAEVKQWIFTTLNVPNDTVEEYERRNQDLIDILKDGEYLCKLGSIALPDGPTKKYKSLKMPFVQMENILFFLQTCVHLGVAHDEIFQTIDLFERSDPYQVIITLIAFSRKVNEKNPKVALIGPKIVKVKPQVPKKPIGLRS